MSWPRDWSSDVCSSDLFRSPLTLPAGELLEALVGLVLQLDQAQELIVRPGVEIEAAVEREQFAHGQGTMEVALLQLHTEDLPQLRAVTGGVQPHHRQAEIGR